MAGKDDEHAGRMLTPLELQIMQVLWDVGPSTVADVRARLGGELAYTTVQTMLNVLLKKKKVTRTAVGRAFAYAPAVTRERAVSSTLKDLISRMFGGSAEALLMALVDTRELTPEKIDEALKLLRKARDDGHPQ